MIQLGSAYGEIQIGTGQAERSVTSLASSMQNVGTKMSLAITAPLTAIVGAGVKAAAGFEQSMNQVETILGATASQMQLMQAQALKLGADTSFSAGEAAAGMLELAKAGFTAEQTMAAIGGVLNLAAAGNLSVAQAAEISANAINAFNLPAEQAGRVADLLAAAANASSVEVTDMAQAFQMSAAVFASNKQGIDDLSTAIAILGNNGLKGSDAGTSLKTMLMRLTAPTDTAAATMRALGIEVYNADGSMRSFQDIVGQLESATSGLTDAQRNQALTTIFGADAIRAANILIKEGSDEFANMKEQVNEVGAAQKVADARMRGLAGAIEYFKGNVESALVEAILPFTGTLSSLIRRGADLIEQFGKLPAPVRNAAIAFAAVLAVAGPLLVAIPAIGAVLGALLSPIGLIVLAVAGLAAAWASNFGGIQEKTAAVWASIQPHFQQIHDWLVANLPTALSGLQSTWNTAWSALPGVVNTVKESVQTAWGAILQFLEPALNRLGASFGNFQTRVSELGPKFQELLAAAQNLWTALQPVLTMLGQLIAGTLGVVAVTAINFLAAAFNHLVDIASIVLDQMILMLNTLATVVTEVVNLITALLRGDWAAAWQAAKNLAGAMLNAIIGTVRNLWNVVKTIFAIIFNTVTGTLEDLGVDVDGALASIQSTFETTWTAIQETVTSAIGAIVSTFETMQTWLTTTLRTAITGFQTFLGGITLPNPFAALQSAINSVRSAIDAVWERIQQFIDWIGGIEIPNPFKGFTIPGIPGYARGTRFAPGGLALVGERGPELVELPSGSRVYNAGDTQRMMGESTHMENHYHIYNDMDLESVARRVAQIVQRRGR